MLRKSTKVRMFIFSFTSSVAAAIHAFDKALSILIFVIKSGVLPEWTYLKRLGLVEEVVLGAARSRRSRRSRV
jgi:hypothetical protein